MRRATASWSQVRTSPLTWGARRIGGWEAPQPRAQRSVDEDARPRAPSTSRRWMRTERACHAAHAHDRAAALHVRANRRERCGACGLLGLGDMGLGTMTLEMRTPEEHRERLHELVKATAPPPVS